MSVMEPVLVHLVEGGVRVAASAFVSGLWQGLVLVACVAVCLRLLPKTTAAIRFLVWGLVFAVLMLLPVLRSQGVGAGGVKAGGVEAGHTSMVHALHVDVRWTFAIAGLWLVLSMLRAGGLALSGLRLRGVWKRATPVEMELAGELLRVGRGRRAVELCTSDDVDCPSVIGFFSPRVLIPAGMFAQLTAAELEQIVLHEMGHLKRGDDWINLLQKIGLVVFPLNPALVWIERRLCFERELACDDDVLRSTKAPKAYATCLTTLAERRLMVRAMPLSLGAWERQSELSRRVYSILRRSEGMSRRQTGFVLGALMLAVTGGAAGFSRCPQLVSFSRAASPVSAVAQSLPAGGYSPVLFHGAGAAHETLLKASMPARRQDVRQAPGMLSGQRLSAVARERSRGAHQPSVQRAPVQRAIRARRGRSQQWVVLTSWDEPAGAKMVLAVSASSVASQDQESSPQVFSTSYAAVRTVGGWLVFQL